MGCFTVFQCLTSSKHPKESTNIGSLQTPVSKSRVDFEDQVINEDVETNTDILYMKSEDVKEGSGKLGVLVQLESAKERVDEEKYGNGKLGVLVQIKTENERKEAKRNSLGIYVDIENGSEGESDEEKEVRTEERKKEIRSGAISDSSVSSYISYPPMHRYYNCVDDDEEHLLIREDSPESLFSVSIDPTRQSKSSPVDVNDKEVNSPLKTSSSPELIENNHDESIGSLLNPIQNLAQQKTMKAGPMPGLDRFQEKENQYIEQEEISRVSDRKGKLKTETVVTTSLLSWVVESDTSWKSFEDRPILVAWNIDEVKQMSSSSSPRKSPCHNPDDTPIIGTVGSYWSHTGQTTDSSNSCTSPLGMSALFIETV